MKIFFLSSSTNQDVIQVTYGLWKTLQHCVHDLLENGRCRGHAKWQSSISKQPMMSIDCDVISGIFLQPHLLVSMVKSIFVKNFPVARVAKMLSGFGNGY